MILAVMDARSYEATDVGIGKLGVHSPLKFRIFQASLRNCKKFVHNARIIASIDYFFSADITTDMLKLCRVTKVKVFFLVLVSLFEFSAAILEKSLFQYSQVSSVDRQIKKSQQRKCK